VSSPPFPIPTEVTEWIRSVFAEVNQRTSAKLSRIPNVHETSLDMTIIEQLSQYAAPFRFPSDWLLRLDTHYLGGPRYWGTWEIADIGILIIYRRKGTVERTKIALLQSKRLYPIESEAPAEDHPVDYEVGFGRLLESEQEFKSAIKQRKFTFTDKSRYRALEYQGDQYKAILKYIQDEGVPVHYLFHNPITLPSGTVLPVEADKNQTDGGLGECEVGCRVVRADALDSRLKAAKLRKLENPSFAHMVGPAEPLDSVCWRLEYFVADLVLSCKEGYRGGTNPMGDSKLFRVFSRRSGPISAAISITIDAPTQ
jgi:hypothetical protein